MFNEREKEYLKIIVKKELKNFEEEKATLIIEENPAFLAVEERYDEFLKNLLNKLK